ncbi:MAG: DUF4330 domain-containing protein [Clostridia bacterium]
MKIIDEKGRLFKFINVVDLAVILAIILVIAGVAYKARQANQGKVEVPDLFLVRVLCPMVPRAAVEQLKPGDQIVYGNAFVNGYVVSVESSPAKIESTDAQGQYTVAYHPDRMDMVVVIRIDNPSHSRLIMLGKYQVNIGKEFVVKTARVEVNGVVLDITE